MAHIPCENLGVEAIRTPGDRDAMTSRRHAFPMDLAGELKAARLAAGWGLPRAAKAVQLDPPMLPSSWWLIEQGRRSPSISVMEAICRTLSFPPDVAARLRAAAIPGVGRDRRLLRAKRRAENRATWAAALDSKSGPGRPARERRVNSVANRYCYLTRPDVPSGPMDLMGKAEVVAALGLTRQRVDQLAVAYPDFPEPVAVLKCGSIWRAVDVRRWIAKHPNRPTGTHIGKKGGR